MKIQIFQNKGRTARANKRKTSKSKSTSNKSKRGEFSGSEKAAYNAGKGFAAAKAGGKVVLKTEKEKQSFRNGMESVKGKKK